MRYWKINLAYFMFLNTLCVFRLCFNFYCANYNLMHCKQIKPVYMTRLHVIQ